MHAAPRVRCAERRAMHAAARVACAPPPAACSTRASACAAPPAACSTRPCACAAPPAACSTRPCACAAPLAAYLEAGERLARESLELRRIQLLQVRERDRLSVLQDHELKVRDREGLFSETAPRLAGYL